MGKVTAYTAAQLESDFSNEISFPELLRIAIARLVGANFQLQFNSSTGVLYRLDRKITFPSGPWTTISNNIPGTGNAIQLTDPIVLTRPIAVYRIAIQP